VLDSNYIKRDYKLLREEVNKQSKKLYKNGSTKLSDPDSSGGGLSGWNRTFRWHR
jgi:hypothetical protein